MESRSFSSPFSEKKKKIGKRLNYVKIIVYNKPGFQFQVYHLKKMQYELQKQNQRASDEYWNDGAKLMDKYFFKAS